MKKIDFGLIVCVGFLYLAVKYGEIAIFAVTIGWFETRLCGIFPQNRAHKHNKSRQA